MMPFDLIDAASSSSRPSSIVVRGWNLFGRSKSMSTSSERSAGAAGASGMSALSPRPSAGRLSAMLWLRLRARCGLAREELPAERHVRFGTAGFWIVGDRGHAVARGFTETDVARNHRVEDTFLEERADVAGHL